MPDLEKNLGKTDTNPLNHSSEIGSNKFNIKHCFIASLACFDGICLQLVPFMWEPPEDVSKRAAFISGVFLVSSAAAILGQTIDIIRARNSARDLERYES